MTKEEHWKEIIRKQAAKRCTQKRIRDRDGPGCKYCGAGKEDGEWWDLQLDHVYPKSKGGGDEDENRALACGACNRKKGNKVSAEYGNEVYIPKDMSG